MYTVSYIGHILVYMILVNKIDFFKKKDDLKMTNYSLSEVADCQIIFI